MGEIEHTDLRISDTERDDAVRMLGEHLSVGRLDVDEYGERTAVATVAKTRGQLSGLFADLPEPKPKFESPAEEPAGPVRPGTAPARPSQQSVGQRVASALVPLSAIVALVLFLTVVDHWWIFLLPAAMMIIGGAIFGGDDRRQARREFGPGAAHGRRLNRGCR